MLVYQNARLHRRTAPAALEGAGAGPATTRRAQVEPAASFPPQDAAPTRARVLSGPRGSWATLAGARQPRSWRAPVAVSPQPAARGRERAVGSGGRAGHRASRRERRSQSPRSPHDPGSQAASAGSRPAPAPTGVVRDKAPPRPKRSLGVRFPAGGRASRWGPRQPGPRERGAAGPSPPRPGLRIPREGGRKRPRAGGGRLRALLPGYCVPG
ncbi:PREDICTED: putative uncharacterized protein FLJ35645 [Haliaeetus leucocephalus]|uniref:putative uncharacterized protein FLJ35645 n=1 Tax=Haliaeetus leucocephalus TaxID=52644 RepID=UPI00053CB9AD|nr:PREDICTED: putative uncharacterized protein FLJ35645 [Haliaeetus leucocephalus]